MFLSGTIDDPCPPAAAPLPPAPCRIVPEFLKSTIDFLEWDHRRPMGWKGMTSDDFPKLGGLRASAPLPPFLAPPTPTVAKKNQNH